MTFNPSYHGVGELLCSPEMVAAMHHFASKGRDAAELLSPVGTPPDPHPGAYKGDWSVESGVRETPSRRAYARITNGRDYAASVEFGNGRMDGQYVLTRAIDLMRE